MNQTKQSTSINIGLLVCFLIGLGGMLFAGWYIFPIVLYSEKSQPVSFSHVKHIEATGLECDECHGFREDGTFQGIPNMTSDSAGACLNCHDDPEALQGDDPREVEFAKVYVDKGVESIDWLVYSRQPPCVFFPHSVHVNKKEIDCMVCHGEIAQGDRPPIYQENRITKYSRNIWGRNLSGLSKNSWDSMKMSDCGDCHDEQSASNACFVCHK